MSFFPEKSNKFFDFLTEYLVTFTQIARVKQMFKIF